MRKEVAICLDEIDACYDKIEKGGLSGDKLSKLKGWVRKRKDELKEIGYKGNFRRLNKKSG